MNATPPASPNRVEWSGENPGIYLKDSEEGPWLTLALYFKVTLSPHGPGRGIVVLANPDKASGVEANNFCITDNETLLRWLVQDYAQYFATFRGKAGLAAMSYLKLNFADSRGDPTKSYTEASGLRRPYCVDVPPTQSGTGKHQMYSLFIHADEGRVLVDGRALPGKVWDRPFLGGTGRTAFLAFAETWLSPV
jgi:hypothetical protein